MIHNVIFFYKKKENKCYNLTEFFKKTKQKQVLLKCSKCENKDFLFLASKMMMQRFPCEIILLFKGAIENTHIFVNTNAK